MLLLKRVEIVNFACFEHVDLDLSVDRENPLTVIRAENGSGKTTFLRALRWGFYGERGLPGENPERFSVHPASWNPADGRVETRVSLTFETDGGTRYQSGSGPRNTYRLTRTVETIAKQTSRDHEPDFRRINASVSLLQKVTGGAWQAMADDPLLIERRVDLLLPWGLRDFFFMDADEATDFVGGRENKPLPKKQVIEKTTAAINELLGLETFQYAMDRVADLQREFQRQASRASGDTSIQEMQDELDATREAIKTVASEAENKRGALRDIEGHREQAYASLQEAIKETGAHDQLDKRLAENRASMKRAQDDRKRTLDRLSQGLEDDGLLAGLMIGQVQDVFLALEPLHQKGLIPLTHVSFVRERLEQGECICGESLAEGTPHRKNVKSLLAESVDQEKHSNLLGSLYESCGRFIRELRSDRSDWADQVDSLRVDLGELDAWIAELTAKHEELDKKIRSIDREHVQALTGELDAADKQISRLKGEIADAERRLQPLRETEVSLDKTISQRQKREQTARDKQAAGDLAGLIGKALSKAYRTIQQEQVRDLSADMNRLFASMAANVPDEDFGLEEEEKATVRMIAEVGVREVEGTQGQFEIFAKNRRGRILPPVEINGASRRVLALSFILSLCLQSKTEAPLIADSLLNMMSGKVRTNTFETAARTSRQPILLLTRADLADEPELAVVSEYAGATYTLTGQWDALDGPRGGDVVNRTVSRLVSVPCACGPREYCSICERQGDRTRSDWEQQPADLQGVLA